MFPWKLSIPMSIYSIQPLKLDNVRTYPLKSRPSKVSVRDFAKPVHPGTPIRQWVNSLPRILAGESFRAVIASLEAAQRKSKLIIWGLGGHVIKCGLGPILIDLMQRGYVGALAMNGAGLVHDFEVALVGATSEDVPAVLGEGRFGMAEETGCYINESIMAADREHLGLGEAAGLFLVRSREAPFRRYSILAAAYKARIPVTIHVAIGTDINHQHPSMDACALGGATYRDFLLLAQLVRKLDMGGVYLNVGSAVILPEVFLKCVSLAANLGRAPRGITTVNMDFIQHYRPLQNVLGRPTATPKSGPMRRSSHGYALTGHHELMIPLLAAALGARKPSR
jgi:hypothetical protein